MNETIIDRTYVCLKLIDMLATSQTQIVEQI